MPNTITLPIKMGSLNFLVPINWLLEWLVLTLLLIHMNSPHFVMYLSFSPATGIPLFSPQLNFVVFFFFLLLKRKIASLRTLRSEQ